MMSIAKMIMKLVRGGDNGKSIWTTNNNRSFIAEVKTNPGKQIVVDHGSGQTEIGYTVESDKHCPLMRQFREHGDFD